MGDSTKPGDALANLWNEMLGFQAEATRGFMEKYAQMVADPARPMMPVFDPAETGHWTEMARKIRGLWTQAGGDAARPMQDWPMQSWSAPMGDPAAWQDMVAGWYRSMPFGGGNTQQALWQDSVKLWEGLLGSFSGDGDAGANLPRKDKRFADPRWRSQPAFALIHQAYLLFAEQLEGLARQAEGLDPAQQEKLRFATRTLIEALSPANFPLTNPVVLDRIVETRGESLIAGMEHLVTDLTRGQLTHTDSSAFELGRNIAVTPGKVVHESRLFQLIQYTPTTDAVMETPLVIFPPWINRYYILDLNPQKSFVRWAVEQGVTTFMVSWRSADSSMADVTLDDYVRAQIEAVDVIRARLSVPSVHAIGYCVAGTTLAATLAVLARRGEAAKVRSATFLTAQVDFELGGELKNFVDDGQLAAIDALASRDGYLDGRYMAATFNLLRGTDLIWNYVIQNYLLGEDYPAFDLLHWNGDTTNLPALWHKSYLRDLYRDNLLVIPDRLSADGTPIDLGLVETPAFVQAGREDHIAPPESVWRLTRHLHGPTTFLLAGSGHIAGVVNPPSSGKYQYWLNDGTPDTLDQFVAGATEHPGSWWPAWRAWLGAQDGKAVPATGPRRPGEGGDTVIEDAPGRYVATR